MSATDSSPVWPMPVQTGLARRGDGAGHQLGVEGGQIRLRSAAPDHDHEIAVGAAQRTRSPVATDAGASPPCTATGATWTWNPNPEPVSWPRKSRYPSVPGLATSPTRSGTSGTANPALRGAGLPPRASRSKLRPLHGQPAQQRRDVELGEDEADLPFGTVEIDRPPQDDDHALGQGDPRLGQGSPHRCPGALPALDLQGGCAPAARDGAAPAVRGRRGPGSSARIDPTGPRSSGSPRGPTVGDFAGKSRSAPRRPRRRGHRSRARRSAHRPRSDRPRRQAEGPQGRRADGHGWTSSTPYRGGARHRHLGTDGRLTGTVSRPGGRSPDRIAGSC